MPPPETSELVARAQGGDGEAFGELVRQFQRRAYRTAFYMTGTHEDADDVAQEAFLRAYRGLAGFDRRAEFGTWLHRIVINTALNHLRSRNRVRAQTTGPEAGERAASTAPDPAGRAESRERARAVLAALASLTPALRVTLVLATVEDMPYKEIAQALGIPEGTVAWRVNQARKQLRQKLAAIAPEAEGNVDEVLRRTKAALGAPG